MQLNPQQQAAVDIGDEHVLVLAGAGTGKTRTIIARAAKLLRDGVEPRRILLLTFTRRAAREMVQRLVRDVGPISRGINAGTFHRFCLHTMRRMASSFGVQDATVIDRDDQLQLMRLARAEYRRKKEKFPTASQLISAVSFARNTNMPLKAYLERFQEHDQDVRERMLASAASYRKRKKDNRYLDFDDLLQLVALRLHRDARLRRRLRSFYDHILVDEMQDTNPLQWLILDGLRDPARLFCVGDDAQSIYAFRGADFRNVHAFTERVPGARVLRLEENYRSTQEILDLSNWLLDQSPLGYGKRLRAARGAGQAPRLLDFEDEYGEAEWLTGDLIERHEQGEPWHSCTVITRTAYAARPLEAELTRKKIPYRFIGGTQLFQAAHVKDLLCLLRAGLSHRDELAWMRYLTMWRGIGDVRASRAIAGMRKRASLDQALGWLQASWKGDPQVPGAPRLAQAQRHAPAEAVRQAAKLLEPLQVERYPNWPQRARDLKLLASLGEAHASLDEFLEAYALDPISTTEVARLEEDDAVNLITVHSAKGTEAPVCYLIRTEPGIYPHIRSLGDTDQE